MSKILISFIGTGPQDSNGREDRKYRSAHYRFGEKSVQSEFVAQALTEFVKPDKLFLIGTPHSMWEKVYDTFSDNVDDEKWDKIDDWCQEANYNTPAEGLPYKEDIEAALGKGSQIFLIRYGLNETQIQENINVILGIRDYLQDGDEIIVDITHSFRSLALLIMQLILYLKQIEKPKVKVTHVYYGMLDISREIDYTPIVDLSGIVKLSDWINGAYAFKLTGASDKINELIANNDSSTKKILTDFSNAISLNDLGKLQVQAQSLKTLKFDDKPRLEALAIQPTIDDFVKIINKAKTASKFQYEIAKWQFKKMNYLASYVSLVECIITKVCEDSIYDNGTLDGKQLDWQDPIIRDIIRGDMRSEKYRKEPAKEYILKYSKELLRIYREINPIRNDLVHQNKGSHKSVAIIISTLDKAIKDLKQEI